MEAGGRLLGAALVEAGQQGQWEAGQKGRTSHFSFSLLTNLSWQTEEKKGSGGKEEQMHRAQWQVAGVLI